MRLGMISTGISGVFVVVGLSMPSIAMADWAYTHWGMTPEQVAAGSEGMVKVLAPDKRTRNADDHWELAAQGTYSEGTLKLPVGFTFDTTSGGLKCVMYNAFDKDIGTVRAALGSRYGKPASESDFGSGSMATWKTPDQIDMVIGQKPVAAVVTHCAPGGG
jgi:hypothetical protein